MRQSQLFPKTLKLAPKGAESINHQLLVRAGFVDQLMAGSWTLLPLGLLVIERINKVIREEMAQVDCLEMAMPLLHPRSIWGETGRWGTSEESPLGAAEIMYQFKDIHDKEFALSFTHEEIVMDLLRKKIASYQDLPVYVYQFSTKFRNEPRAKSGILRGREFMMKDAYSAHASEKDLMDYYERMKGAYSKIFTRLGFDFKITEASGGVFTENHTHEFQVLSSVGEDTIYYCSECDWGVNKEIYDGKSGDVCPSCGNGKVVEAKSIEVGNIFPLGTWYAEKMGVYFTNDKGEKKPVWFGSYGIGPTRAMGTWVEVSHDAKGIIWNKEIAPFDVHLVELPGGKGEAIYNELTSENFTVLWDDREVGAGQKFADSDLIGIPTRLVTSAKTADDVEMKSRSSDESKVYTLEQIIKLLR